MGTTDRIVIFIEDDPEDADVYPRLLTASGRINVQHLAPLDDLTDYAELAAHPSIGAVIVDQRLSPRSGVPYSGYDVVQLLRSLRPELPIYMLTNYSREIPPGSRGSAEVIIVKGEAIQSADDWAQVIQRAMERYDKALTAQQSRFKELIDRKLTTDLTPEEEEELLQLRAALERPYALAEFDREAEWDTWLELEGEQLKRLEDIAQAIRQLFQQDDE